MGMWCRCTARQRHQPHVLHDATAVVQQHCGCGATKQRGHTQSSWTKLVGLSHTLQPSMWIRYHLDMHSGRSQGSAQQVVALDSSHLHQFHDHEACRCCCSRQAPAVVPPLGCRAFLHRVDQQAYPLQINPCHAQALSDTQASNHSCGLHGTIFDSLAPCKPLLADFISNGKSASNILNAFVS